MPKEPQYTLKVTPEQWTDIREALEDYMVEQSCPELEAKLPGILSMLDAQISTQKGDGQSMVPNHCLGCGQIVKVPAIVTDGNANHIFCPFCDFGKQRPLCHSCRETHINEELGAGISA